MTPRKNESREEFLQRRAAALAYADYPFEENHRSSWKRRIKRARGIGAQTPPDIGEDARRIHFPHNHPGPKGKRSR
jgi:hypothetical protein